MGLGNSINSSDSRFHLNIQNDWNLVLYAPPAVAVRSSVTGGQPNVQGVFMQSRYPGYQFSTLVGVWYLRQPRWSCRAMASSLLSKEATPSGHPILKFHRLPLVLRIQMCWTQARVWGWGIQWPRKTTVVAAWRKPCWISATAVWSPYVLDNP